MKLFSNLLFLFKGDIMATLADLESHLAASDAAAAAKAAEVQSALDALKAQIAAQIDVIPQSVLDSVDALTIKITAIPSA